MVSVKHAVDDNRWRQDRDSNGWRPPAGMPASRLLRLPGVRWLRAVWHGWRVYRAAEQWGRAGIGLGQPNQYDVWVVYAVHRGWF